MQLKLKAVYVKYTRESMQHDKVSVIKHESKQVRHTETMDQNKYQILQDEPDSDAQVKLRTDQGYNPKWSTKHALMNMCTYGDTASLRGYVSSAKSNATRTS